MKIVKFKNGMYGVRKFCFFSMDWVFVSEYSGRFFTKNDATNTSDLQEFLSYDEALSAFHKAKKKTDIGEAVLQQQHGKEKSKCKAIR